MVVRRHRRLQDCQRLQTSTLATHSNDHPDVPTPQSVRWRHQLPACQHNIQHVNTTTTQHPWTARAWTTSNKLGLLYNPKETAFLLLPLERRHQPRPGLREFRPGQPTAGQTCPRKVPWSQHRPSLITHQDSRFLPTEIQ